MIKLIMARKRRFHLARLTHIGPITPEEVARSILSPSSLEKGDYSWTFIDQTKMLLNGREVIHGKLAKFSRLGSVEVVDRDQNTRSTADVEDLLIATSEFVYVPDLQGIAFSVSWGHVPEKLFRGRFADLVMDSIDRLMLEVRIEMVSEYEQFLRKTRKISRILDLKATVVPPNPLFGHLWKPLRDYLDGRNLKEMKIAERGADSDGLRSRLKRLLELIADDDERVSDQEPLTELGDAAVMMAADGYGEASISGVSSSGEKITVSTSRTEKTFNVDANAVPEQIGGFALDLLDEINSQRYLEERDN